MKEIEFFRNISIGQYFEADTWATRLAPAAKLLFVSLAMVSILLSRSIMVLVFIPLPALLSARLARISCRYIAGGLKPALPFILIIAVLQIVFMTRYDDAPALLEIWKIRVTAADLVAAAQIIFRFIGLMFFISFFTAITPTSEIVHGTEQILRPLSRLGIPAHEISMVVAVAFRFIPILAREAEKIMKAQASRGADFGTRRRGFLNRLRAFYPIFIPLFVAALERAEDMIVSMEARCYTGGYGRSKLVQYPLRKNDYIFIVLILVGFTALSWVGIQNFDNQLMKILDMRGGR